ncbi:MAG: FCD domain-containing protein [Verrucomicrobia bacterium]|nr:FCD domain-containing protein [Verrucomicrobiota bacterium]
MKSRLNPPLTAGSPVDRAYSEIRYAILEGQFPPETHLTETPLAEHLGAGRFHIREALMRLVGEGLVERVRNAGFFVRHCTVEEIEETFEIRSALECLAVRIACRRGFSEFKLAEMEHACDAMESASRKGDWRAADHYDLEFHRLLVGLANSQRVEALVQGAHVQVFSWMSGVSVENHRADTEGVLRTHRRIIQALRTRDAEGAVELVYRHTAPIFSNLLAAAAQEKDRQWMMRHMGSVGEMIPKRRTGASSKRSFTLIELLVVVAIISILAALLMPSLKSARNQAKSIACMNNLKQIGTALVLYMNDNEEYLPPASVYFAPWPEWLRGVATLDWMGYLGKKYPQYGGPLGTRVAYPCSVDCPSTPMPGEPGIDTTYGRSYLFTNPIKYQVLESSALAVPIPSRICFCFDGGFYQSSTFTIPTSYAFPRHSNGINVLFCDWHVAWYSWSFVEGRSVHPNGGDYPF